MVVQGSTPVPPRSWGEVPSGEGRARSRELLGRAARPATALAMVVIVVVAPVVRIASIYGWRRAAVVGAIGLAGLVLHTLLRDTHWLLRGAIAAVAGAAVVPFGGLQTGLWIAFAIVLAGWGVLQRPPLPFLPTSSEAVLPLVALSLVAAWRERTTWSWDVFIIFAVLTIVAIFVTSRWEGLAKRFGTAVGRWLSLALFGILSIVTVVLPWATFRLLRSDPLEGTSPDGSNWSRLRNRDLQPDRPWMWAARRRRPLRERPWQQWAAALVLLVAAGGFLWQELDSRGTGSRVAYSISDPEGTEVPDAIPAAFAGDEWYPKYREDIDYAYTWLDLFPPVDGLGLPDFESRYFNTSDGVRQTWSPPECDCRRLTVWMYGASTVLGLGQRDDHTIPSELARIAWNEGLALDVVNRGIPGEQHWQEANRLRWDLTRHDPPDVVVFYDGASDTVGASWLNREQLGDVDVPVQPLTEEFLDDPTVSAAIDAALRGDAEPPPPPGSITPIPPSTVADMGAEEVGELAVSRYETSRTLSRDLTEASDLTTFWFWQPTRLSRPPVEGETATDSDDEARRTVERSSELVPPGVVDLSDVLDADLRPMFSDDAHHNEAAARIIAEAMYAELRPTLVRLAEEP